MALTIVITSIDEITNTSCKIHYTATVHWSAWYNSDAIEIPDDGTDAWHLSEYWLRLNSLEANTEYDVYLKGKEGAGSEWENSNTETFTTTNVGGGAPTKAKTPSPIDTADDVTLDQKIVTWEDGGGATSYDVYYGDTSGSLSLVSGGQVGLSFTIWDVTLGSPFDYSITRYWRIDAINAVGETTGDEWSFTSIVFDPPVPTAAGSANPNAMQIIKRLVVAAWNKIYYEDI